MRPVAVAVLASVLAAGGCGGARPTRVVSPSASQWDPSTMPDPCRLVSQPEVADAVARPVSTGTRLQTWPPLCRFVIDQESQTFVYLSDDPRPSAVDDYQRNEHTTNVTQPVTGLGDRAYWLPQVTTLHVLSAGTQLVVMFHGGRVPPDALSRAVTLARIALRRTGS